MPAVPLPLATYALASPQASSARLLNCFFEQAPQNAKSQVILRRCAGIRPFTDVLGGSGRTRGQLVMGGVLYAVIGAELFQIDADGSETSLGDIPGSQLVSMSCNPEGTLVIVTPEDGFAYHWSDQAPMTDVTQIVDATFLAFGGVGDVVFIDGFFIFRVLESARFFHSGPNALTFNALDVATAEGAPDNLVGMIADHRDLILPGTDSMEIWYNADNETGSVFSRSPDGFLEQGCAASRSLLKQDNSVFWLCNDLTFRRLKGIVGEKISNYGIDGIVQTIAKSMGGVSDCFGFSYTQEGHLMAAWTFPSAGRTVVYDCSTGEWHERDSQSQIGGAGIWRPSCVAIAYGKQTVGDYISGQIGFFDADHFTEFDDEQPQRVSWTYQTVYAEAQRVNHRRFQLVTNVGSGVISGQGENPLATLKISDDGGNTYRTLPLRSLGRRGNYKARAVWWNLGSAADRGYRVEVTDPIPLFTMTTLLEATGARP